MSGKKKGSSSLDMLHGPIAVKLILFAIPVALCAVLQQLFNSADMIVVGRFSGSNSLAAVGANTFIINLMVNLFVGLSIGSNVVIARYIGQGDHDGVRKAVHSSIAISLLSGLFLSVLGWFVAESVLQLIGTPQEIINEATLYFRIYFTGMPFAMLFNFTTAILRSKGDTKRPLYVLVVSGILNLLLNIFFVVNLKLSVAGVALATIISTFFSSLANLWMLMHEEGDLKVSLGKIKMEKRTSLLIAKVGIPAGIQGAIFSFSNVLVQGGINTLGAKAVAAITAALNFEYFSYFVQNSFAQAGISFLGQNYGAGNKERCKKIIRWSIILGAGSTAIVSWMFIILRYGLAGFFSTDAEVIELAASRILIVCALYCVNSINDVLSSLMRAVGYSLMPAIICVIGICGVRVVWLYTVFYAHPTYDMLNYCYPLSWIVSACVMVPTAYYIIRKQIRKLTPLTTEGK